MSYNGSGVFIVNSVGQPVVATTLIESATFNAFTADVATGLSTAITKDGQTVVTADIPFGGNKLTGVGAPTGRTDAATLASIQDGTGIYSATVGGTADVITITPSPAITAYAAGQAFYWIASGANTTNVTINVNGLGAKAVTKNGSTALVAGDVPSGALVGARYDGTQFQLIGAGAGYIGSLVEDTTPQLGGALDTNSFSINKSKGANIAAATTTNIWSTDGDTVHLTGNTQIDDFADAPQAGVEKTIIFDGTPQVTSGSGITVFGGTRTAVVGDRLMVSADAVSAFIAYWVLADGTAVTAGKIVQVVNVMDGAVATGTTVQPNDDTIPQNDEGDEYMTRSITPTNSSNKLIIEVIANVSTALTGGNATIVGSIFQDSTAGALATTIDNSGGTSLPQILTIRHYMTAGTTSSTTFKFRFGVSSAGTNTFNGFGGVRKAGGALASSITITEILA